MFLDLADGVDDPTWLHHLRRGDYSDWLRNNIKDESLAKHAAEIEQDPSLEAQASRQAFRTLIEQLYTLAGGRREEETSA